MTDRTEEYHTALGSVSRRQVLDALRHSPEPLDATAIADQLGLHVTTARFHLDHLTDARLVQRSSGTEKRRGRPRLLYSPAGTVRDDDARGQLIEVLAGALAREKSPDVDSSNAGRRWAGTFSAPDQEDPVPGLMGVFDRLGFEPESDRESGTIRLHACPFRGAAREHPEIVCNVHRGLIDQLLEGAEPQARLIPFVEPELCMVSFDRRHRAPVADHSRATRS
ncbi:MAG: helix-turn-helix domain-containing protein [Salinibacterium sp.]|nr:helix-turn-helix domain-containing protein [Salinibacterium sp.]